jgi:hypothetical protein
MNVPLTSLSPTVLIVLGVLALAELVLDVVALVDLYRRPAARVTLPSKWIWVVIIVLVNLVGAILYFAIGRRPAPATDPRSGSTTPPTRSASEIADALYGKDDEAPKL